MRLKDKIAIVVGAGQGPGTGMCGDGSPQQQAKLQDFGMVADPGLC